MKIFCKFPTLNMLKFQFWLVICIAKNFTWTTLKAIFSVFRFFCTLRLQIFNSCISAKYCPILSNHGIHQWKDYVFSFQMMYKSKFNKIYTYDLFCGQGSHMKKKEEKNIRLMSVSWSPFRLFLVIDYVNGGDLMFHMQRQRKLPEEHSRCVQIPKNFT